MPALRSHPASTASSQDVTRTPSYASADRLELQGLGAAGASGSPIIDRDGSVVGVLFGGRTEAGVQILSGVSANAIASFLERIPVQ